MFTWYFPSGALGANCYVLGATRPGGAPVAGERPGDCVIVDPGQDSARHLAEALDSDGLRPVAVLLTHGHLDHVADAARVCRAFDLPAYLHQADQYMLDDPLAGLSPQLRAGITTLLGPDDDLAALRPPDVRSPEDGKDLALAGLSLFVDHVPGHTGGSVVYRVPAGTSNPTDLLFTGDTLFAGSIGRTDLPGGSTSQILASIAGKLLTRADDAVVLPGHGPRSTIGAERATNPFLRPGGMTP